MGQLSRDTQYPKACLRKKEPRITSFTTILIKISSPGKLMRLS